MNNRLEEPSLIIGCGYLGQRVALAWKQAGRRVVALTRGRTEELTKLGIEPVVGDVMRPESLKALPKASTVLYAVGMDRSASRTMHEVYVHGLANVLKSLPGFQRLIYISSTSVYGQTSGEVVSEESETKPLEDSGVVVLEAERTLRQLCPLSVVLRFAGIYGPYRLIRRMPILNRQPFYGDAEKWLNLIHVQDGVNAVLRAEVQASPGETYNISDDTPVTRRNFYSHLAELLDSAPALFEDAPPPAKPEPNRRISNRKAREQLGFVPQFPSFREGLAQALTETTIL